MGQNGFIDLATLQDVIKEQIGELEAWVKVEIDSCNCSGGHWYLGFIQKNARGAELARARGIIWRWKADLLNYFRQASGKDLGPGMEVLVRVAVNYDARYGLSLIVNDIDADFTVGQREKEKAQTLEKLQKEGLLEAQKELDLPFLPGRIAVISSADAAGYGDFCKQLAQNPYGYGFDTTLFHCTMQGDNSPASIADGLQQICSDPQAFDLVLVMRGGGAESDLFCYDEYLMCSAIAACPIPVLTAIGHDRDFHIADLVANRHFKTPTALAAFLVDWVYGVESQVQQSVANIAFALNSRISEMEHAVSLLEAGIKAADPRSILEHGYVLASDSKGRIIKSADAAAKGDSFGLRFANGQWQCSVNEVELYKK